MEDSESGGKLATAKQFNKQNAINGLMCKCNIIF